MGTENPKFADYKAFRESRRQYTEVDGRIENLSAMWPAFARALSEFSSEQEVPDVFNNPDSGMILLALSSPNLEKLMIHDETGQFVAAFNGIFRTMEINDNQHERNPMQTVSATSEFLQNLKTVEIAHSIQLFSLQLLVPILSFVPPRELILEEINDVWMHPENPAFSFTEFNWLAAELLMTIQKLAIPALDTKQSSLKTFLAKVKHLKSLWLGFGSWTTFGSCARDQLSSFRPSRIQWDSILIILCSLIATTEMIGRCAIMMW